MIYLLLQTLTCKNLSRLQLLIALAQLLSYNDLIHKYLLAFFILVVMLVDKVMLAGCHFFKTPANIALSINV